jgi:hypothetical protein
MLIELVTGTLPWRGMARKDSGQLKEAVTAAQLCQGCPSSFSEINATLKKLTYHDEPGYAQFREWIKKDLGNKTKGYVFNGIIYPIYFRTESLDLDNPKKKAMASDEEKVDQQRERDKDEKAEIDEMVNCVVIALSNWTYFSRTLTRYALLMNPLKVPQQTKKVIPTAMRRKIRWIIALTSRITKIRNDVSFAE